MATKSPVVIAPEVSIDAEDLRRIEALYAHPGEKVRLTIGTGEDQTISLVEMQGVYGYKALTVTELAVEKVGAINRVTYRFAELEGSHPARFFERNNEHVSSFGTLISRDGEIWFHPLTQQQTEDGALLTDAAGNPALAATNQAWRVNPEFTRSGKYAMNITGPDGLGLTLEEYAATITETPTTGDFHFVHSDDGSYHVDFVTWQASATSAEKKWAEQAVETGRQASRSRADLNFPRPLTGHDLTIDPSIQPGEISIESARAHYALLGETVVLSDGRFAGESDEALARRRLLLGNKALTVQETRVDRVPIPEDQRDSISAATRIEVRYRFAEVDGVHNANGFNPPGLEHGYGTLIARDGSLWFHPLDNDQPIDPPVSKGPARLVDGFTRAGQYSIGAAGYATFVQEQTSSPSTGEFNFVSGVNNTLRFNYVPWHAGATDKEIGLAEQAITQVLGRTQPTIQSKQEPSTMADQPNDRKPTIEASMYFRFDGKNRESISTATTFEAILAGERTSTTRFPVWPGYERYKSLNASDVIRFFEDREMKGRFVDVSVTGVRPINLSTIDAAQLQGWSQAEGWSPAAGREYGRRYGEGLQVTFTTIPELVERARSMQAQPSAIRPAVAEVAQSRAAEPRNEPASPIRPAPAPVAESGNQFDPGNNDTLPPELTYDDWRAHRDALAEEREQQYARDTMEIAEQQARAEITRAHEVNAGVWLMAGDRQDRGIFVLNRQSPLYNPDRRAVTLPNERGMDVDPFRAAEALWQHLRRTMAGGGLDAAQMLNAAAVAYRSAAHAASNIEQGDVHKNAEHSVHLTDTDTRDRPITVVAHTEQEAKVIRGFLELADRLLPRDRDALRSNNTQTLVKMVDGQPVLPDARLLAKECHSFRPRHPAMLSEKESVAVHASHGCYDLIAPAMKAVFCDGRKVVAIEGACADRSHADEVVRKVDHNSYIVSAWKTNIELLSRADRAVVIWNCKPRDPALHLIANAVRSGRPVTIYDGTGRVMDPVAVSCDAVREFPSTRERDAMTLRDDLVNLGHMGGPIGQVFLKSLGFSAENAMNFGLNNVTGADIAAAVGSVRDLASLAKQAKVPSSNLRSFNEGPQRIQAAMMNAKAIMAMCDQKKVEVITPFSSDRFPRKLAADYPVLFVAGNVSRLAEASSRGIVEICDRVRPVQQLGYEQSGTKDRPNIMIDGARSSRGNLVAAVIVTAGDVDKVMNTLGALGQHKAVVSAELPNLDRIDPTIDVQALRKTNPSVVSRSIDLAVSLGNGVLAGDTLLNGMGRETIDTALSKGKPVAIEDPRSYSMTRVDSYTHQLRDLIDAKLKLDGKSQQAQALQANPDHENVVEKLRYSERRQLCEESAVISTMTPKQLADLNQTASLVTVLPNHSQYGPAMERLFLAKAQDRSQPAQQRVAGTTR